MPFSPSAVAIDIKYCRWYCNKTRWTVKCVWQCANW